MSEPHADNTSISVVVNVHQGYMDMYGYTHYGVVCGTSEDVTKESGTIMDMKALRSAGYPDGYYEASLTGLYPGTMYYIRPYYSRFDALHHGDAVEIVTMGNAGNGGPVFFEESANCYLVSSSGTYKFRAVKGNSSGSVGAVALAEVLWESFGTDVVPEVGDLIESVTFSDGYISFVVPVQFKEGNAVIAAKDASGQILWSWHIWLTDQPEEQVYYNDAGTMMDRNLGATSATPGDVGALGLLYQWGRKDPFLGSSMSSSYVWPEPIESDFIGLIDYSISNPTTFISQNALNMDWNYTGDSSVDNTRWTTSDKEKSIYDPCPAGWRVPDGGEGGVWATATGVSTSVEGFPFNDSGMNFSGLMGDDSSIWYPAPGMRGTSYSFAGIKGFYWSATTVPGTKYANYLGVREDGNVDVSSTNFLSRAFSIRCMKEGTGGGGADQSWIMNPDSDNNLWKDAKMDVSFWFSDNSWNQIADPEYSSTGNNYHKIVIPEGIGTQRWQGQMVFNHTGIVVSPTKSYDFQIILNSTADHPHVIVKGCYEESSILDPNGFRRDINPLINEEWVVLTANQDMVLHYTGLQGSAIPDFKLVMDFAGAAAGSEVVIKDIVLRESSSQSASVPKDWYLTGEFNNWEVGDKNYKMTLTGGWYVFQGLEVNSDSWFKFVGEDWSRSRGYLDSYDCVEGQVFETGELDIPLPAGTYNVYMSYDTTMAYFESMISSYEDLSASGTANCYIVNKAGAYSFTPTMGNSNDSVGTIANAEVLWESFGTDVTPSVGDLIRNVKYQNGIVRFETALAFREGNAVIAAKDASGQILWSWHIWLTDKPEEQVYYNDAGTMMDRNLGATSATPGDVGALGLLYQWGRKDPFLGSSSISDNIEAKSTIAWPSAVSSDSSNGTIAYATANPTTFITANSSNEDWYYTGSSTTDNTRWTTSETMKSIYDPCPVGWRVPDGGNNGIWSKALGSSSFFKDPLLYDSTNEGMNFSGKFGSASTIWYPFSGFRSDHIGGGLGNVGNSGYYWSASSISYYADRMSFNGSGSVEPSLGIYRVYGQSVRCIRE